MSREIPEFDPSPDDAEGPDVSSERLSTTTLAIAIAVMLLPAGIPLYFALRLGGTIAIWLVALSGVIAVVNVLLVVAVWKWVNSLRTNS